MTSLTAENTTAATAASDLISLEDMEDLREEPPPALRISIGLGGGSRVRRRREVWFSRIFAWGVSLLIHVIVLLALVLVYLAIRRHFAAKPQPMIVPASFFGGTVNSRHHATADHVGRKISPDQQVFRRSWSAAVSPNSLSHLLQQPGARKTAIAIGLGAGGGAQFETLQTPGAVFSKLSGGPGKGPVTSFFGVQSRASRVVYLIDTSGSMIGKLHLVKHAVEKSLHSLLPFQKFAVIVFAHNYRVLGPDHLLPAQGHYRRQVKTALQKIYPEGANDNQLRPFTRPFRAAFAMRPDVIFFLTDGHFDKRLVPYVEHLNRGANVRVCTFAFLDRDPVFQRRLRRIARETGGQFEYVSERILYGP